MRLIDRMLNEQERVDFPYGTQFHSALSQKKLIEATRPVLAGAVHIVADNVAEYLFADSDQEVWKLNEDFPCLAPPFDNFWIECVRPSAIQSGAIRRPASEIPYRWGVHFMAAHPGDIEITAQDWEKGDHLLRERLEQIAPRLDGLVAQYGAEAAKHLTPVERELLQALQVRMDPTFDPSTSPVLKDSWWIEASLYCEVAKGRVIGPCAIFQYTIDPAGRSLAGRNSALPSDEPILDPRLRGQLEEVARALDSLMFAPLLAISFMHCKNVKRVEQTPDAKLSRAHRRRHGQELTKFYTLEIDPMRQVLATEGQSGKVGLKRALHICRGHFAHYSEEKPLFGRVSGTFWRPAHVRGSSEAGRVYKDYAVNPKTNGAAA